MFEKFIAEIKDTIQARVLVGDLEKPLKIIIEKIKEEIERGEFGIIIGDDVSGRIPALILGKFIQDIAAKRSQKKPGLVFIPGKLDKDYPENKVTLNSFLVSHGFEEGKKVLIVTDTIGTGNSLHILVTMLQELNIRTEIVTIGLSEDKLMQKQRAEALSGATIISGEYENKKRDTNRKVPRIYGQNDFSGVYKEFTKNTGISKTMRDKEDAQTVNSRVTKIREDVESLADKLLKWYEK